MPLPVRVPEPLITAPAAGVNTAFELIVNVPEAAKFVDMATIELEGIVSPLKVSEPVLTTVEPLFNVMVPPVGENVMPPLTVSDPAMLKLAEG